MDKNRGWIALDIDGTITLDKYTVPDEVRLYLRSLTKKGWRLAFATGRPFTFAKAALSQFDFPFLFLPQNGSLALEMPKEQVLFKKYLGKEAISLVEEAYQGLSTDFLVYAGFEKGDFCYFRPSRLSTQALAYLEDVKARQKEAWVEVEEFAVETFPMIKCFGSLEEMREVKKRLIALKKFELAAIVDPFDQETTLLLVTAKEASKGQSLQECFQRLGRGKTVIGAGDDENDLSLLEISDIKIAMSHAPKSVKERADFIAPPTKDHGIIKALEEALKRNGD